MRTRARKYLLLTALLLATGTAASFALPLPRGFLLFTGAATPAISDDELRRSVAQLVATPPPPPTASQQAMAELGRRLFFDVRFSQNGQVACSTCHDPNHAFTDGRPVAEGLSRGSRNAPSVANTYLDTWFMWDGRADSLAAQALLPIEDPREHGVSRVFLARRLLEHYKDDYERLFGPFPSALTAGPLPDQGLPAAAPGQLKVEVAAYALATLGSSDLLGELLGKAQAERLQPAQLLGQRALTTLAQDQRWTQAYAALPDATKQAVDRVFFNFGRAIAAYELGLVGIDAPFDAFAKRWQPDLAPEAALGAGFGAKELAGLRLFAGRANCTLCHTGPNFTDQQFHNIGLPQRGNELALGRAVGVLKTITDPFNCQGPLKDPNEPDMSESCRELPFLDRDSFELVGAFKTPSLRNVGKTAPYMHDGRFNSLSEVVDHYDELDDEPAVGHREESLQPLKLAPAEKEALIAFLRSLDSEISDLNLP